MSLRTTRKPSILAAAALLTGLPACGPSEPAALAVSPELSDPPKLLIIGIDGIDLRSVEQLAAQGRLPHLARMMENGVATELATVANASPIIWTTVATGVLPEKHGIQFFRDENNQPAASTMRKRPAFWNMLTYYGHTVGVLSWWASFPAEMVNGYMVSPYCVLMPPKGTQSRVGKLWDAGVRKVHPEELQSELADLILFEPQMTSHMMGDLYAGKKKTTNTKWVLAKDLTYYNSALHLLQSRPVEVAAVYFQGVDAAGHDFDRWVYGGNRNEVRDPLRGQKDFDEAMERVWAMYEYNDQMVGGLIAGLPPDTDVIVLSDHGWNYDGTSHWNDDPGVFIAMGPSFEARGRFEGLSVEDVTPIILAIMGVPLSRDFDGRVPPGLLRDDLEAGVEYVAEYSFPAVALPEGTSSAVPENETMTERLKALGYIGEDGDMGSKALEEHQDEKHEDLDGGPEDGPAEVRGQSPQRNGAPPVTRGLLALLAIAGAVWMRRR